jgi:hypothetical protein
VENGPEWGTMMFDVKWGNGEMKIFYVIRGKAFPKKTHSYPPPPLFIFISILWCNFYSRPSPQFLDVFIMNFYHQCEEPLTAEMVATTSSHSPAISSAQQATNSAPDGQISRSNSPSPASELFSRRDGLSYVLKTIWMELIYASDLI